MFLPLGTKYEYQSKTETQKHLEYFLMSNEQWAYHLYADLCCIPIYICTTFHWYVLIYFLTRWICKFNPNFWLNLQKSALRRELWPMSVQCHQQNPSIPKGLPEDPFLCRNESAVFNWGLFFFCISVLWAVTIGHKWLLPRRKMKTSPQAKHYTLSLIFIFWGGQISFL